ncbi:MAG: PQQ-binding-like beta-propeller repeat protein, partial [Gemmataceae bacterium]|nr:PQQ-binding-like beta-propeller repeat protein [Gemmataceae bacterium]
YLNRQGVQHRDIKPQNLLLVGGGVKVADFGLAKVLEQTVATASGGMTPAYASPEQINAQVSRWSDQYSLAVTYCQLRGGQLPFQGNQAQILTGHLMNAPDLSMVPEGERPALQRALAKKPQDRWPTCTAFVAALAAGKKPSAPTPTVVQSAETTPRRSSWPLVVCAAALLATGLFALLLWHFTPPPPDQQVEGGYKIPPQPDNGNPSTGADEFPPGAADNWHQWRGPLATGMAPKGNPPLNWDEKTNVRWKVAIPGIAHSTPVVWGDRIFVLTAVPNLPNNFNLICLDRHTGAVRWERDFEEKVPDAAAATLTDGQRVYAFCGAHGLHCYDLDGKPLWQRRLGKLPARPVLPGSPAVYKDRLVVPCNLVEGSVLFGLDPRTGKELWKVKDDEQPSRAAPLIVKYKGQVQVVMTGTKQACGYDLVTGKKLWDNHPQVAHGILPLPPGSGPSPVSDGEVVYCLRREIAYAIPLHSPHDPRKLLWTRNVAWRPKGSWYYVPSPLLDGGQLYFTAGNEPTLTCLDIKAGRTVFDKVLLPKVDMLSASPVGAAERLYFVGRNGTTVVLDRHGTKPKVLAVNQLDGRFDASPVIVGRRLYLCSNSCLYCLEEPK